ncbi:phosphotriesterase family protein [Catenulispora pinisilvae]|uniref:phosphotriesterase family protein n=1 Tax=Catenulispora pinisilvae TaxID=2705253 RepID=UPI0018921BCC|nr:aryldialkylphosphatase [Catenulispora pinisilvae]
MESSQAVCRTVRGDVDPGGLGRVLTHEHLLSLLPGPGVLGGPAGAAEFDAADFDATEFDEARIAAAVAALSGLRASGFGTVVDLSPYGDAGRDAHGANAALLPRIAEASGLHVISGTATYRAEFSPEWVRRAGIDELVDRFVADATTGIGESGVRAGILGEQPTSEGRVLEHEERGLRAVGRAHHRTGLSINTHTTHGTMALEQIDLLQEEEVPLDRVVIGHMDNHPDLDYVRRVLDRGVTVGFDSIGKEYWDVRRPPPDGRQPDSRPDSQPDGRFDKPAIKQSDRTRAHRLATLVAEGYADQIVLSQHLTGGQMWLNPATHGRHGYGYLGRVFLTHLGEHGISSDAIDRMLIANPARLLAVGHSSTEPIRSPSQFAHRANPSAKLVRPPNQDVPSHPCRMAP